MKASIITMTCTYNYGATLQAYALQHYIESLGHTCNVIDHMGWTGHRKVLGDGFSKDVILKLPYAKQLEKGYSNFEDFYKQYMHMTKRYNTIDDLRADPPASDVFVTGSDQVWNPRDFRGEFYLDFAPNTAKKISYAASIGVPSISDNKKDIIRDHLRRFDQISVRETTAFEAIQELTDKKVSMNCDPVFLLDEDEWRKIQSEVDISDEYIFCYMIYKPDWINDWLKEVRRITKKKIVFMGLNGFRPVECDRYIRSAGPREFLWLVDHASGVVSSSFHGVAFSVLFGKPLVALPDPPRPDRIHNLLRMFQLENRILYNNSTDAIMEAYDKAEKKRIIVHEQRKSKEYFDEAFA